MCKFLSQSQSITSLSLFDESSGDVVADGFDEVGEHSTLVGLDQHIHRDALPSRAAVGVTIFLEFTSFSVALSSTCSAKQLF